MVAELLLDNSSLEGKSMAEKVAPKDQKVQQPQQAPKGKVEQKPAAKPAK
jgi:hypothetical protein